VKARLLPLNGKYYGSEIVIVDDYGFEYCVYPEIVERSTEDFYDPNWKPPKTIEIGPMYENPTKEQIKEMEIWLKNAKKKIWYFKLTSEFTCAEGVRCNK